MSRSIEVLLDSLSLISPTFPFISFSLPRFFSIHADLFLSYKILKKKYQEGKPPNSPPILTNIAELKSKTYSSTTKANPTMEVVTHHPRSEIEDLQLKNKWLRFLFSASHQFLSLAKNPVAKATISCTTTTYSTLCLTHVERVLEEGTDHPKESVEVLREWGCSQLQFERVLEEDKGNPKDSVEVLKQWGCKDNDISKLFLRRPSLRNADILQLQSKLSILSGLGLTSSDLVKIIHCRPRFLSCRINHCFDERIDFFMTLFGSKEMLRKAIIRNPSLLTYGFHNRIRPVIELYEGIGISRKDLIPMLLSRPTLIPRTSFSDEKMEYIRKSGVSKDSKMFKYVATLIGISRLETIQEKAANFEKFGFSNDEVWGLFGRSPLLLTLSVDKIQRNMTFVVGTMKLPANVVLEHAFLLFNNLDAVLKPRLLLAGKIQEMDLQPQINPPAMLRVLRMKEKRFLKVFVTCHPEDVAKELMEFYRNTKGIKRLAEASKKIVRKGFPF